MLYSHLKLQLSKASDNMKATFNIIKEKIFNCIYYVILEIFERTEVKIDK